MNTNASAKNSAVNVGFTLGAALIDDHADTNARAKAVIDQDYWGSSMNLAAVLEGRIFGVFGVSSKAQDNVKGAKGAQ